MTTRKIRKTGLFALSILLMLPASAQVWAAADGLPHLDPTNGNAGTTYAFLMPQISRSMDPLTPSNQRVYRGTFTLLQDQGNADFDIVDMEVDTSGDGVPDRTLRCSGWNGANRFGFRCSEDDGGNDFRILITGRVVRFSTGRLSLRKATGLGFTDTHTLLFSFVATSF